MEVKVKALDSFHHGRMSADIGKEYTFHKGEADELAKLGLVEIMAEKAEPAAETKMEAAPKNKMADAPVNKAAKKAD